MTKPRKRSSSRGPDEPTPPAKRLPKDVAILHGPTEDGQGARVLRFKEGNVYSGEVRPVREGQSIGHQELVRLRPIDRELPVCEVEVLHAPEAQPAAAPKRKGTGPARVTSAGYRRNWGAVFGRDRDEPWSLN